MNIIRFAAQLAATAVVALTVSACGNASETVEAPVGAAEEFFISNPQYGAPLTTEEMPDWARGERKQVRTDRGTYLVYLHDGDVVTVYRTDQGREEVFRQDKPEDEFKAVEQAAFADVPAYTIPDRFSLVGGKMAGDVIVPDLSRSTPKGEREEILRVIMEKEGLDEAALYCSQEAMKSNLSQSYRDANPGELERCYLGQIRNGGFEASPF